MLKFIYCHTFSLSSVQTVIAAIEDTRFVFDTSDGIITIMPHAGGVFFPLDANVGNIHAFASEMRHSVTHISDNCDGTISSVAKGIAEVTQQSGMYLTTKSLILAQDPAAVTSVAVDAKHIAIALRSPSHARDWSALNLALLCNTHREIEAQHSVHGQSEDFGENVLDVTDFGNSDAQKIHFPFAIFSAQTLSDSFIALCGNEESVGTAGTFSKLDLAPVLAQEHTEAADILSCAGAKMHDGPCAR